MKIFVDLDGVVADFAKGFDVLYGMPLESVSEERLKRYKKRFAADRFFRYLPVYEGAYSFIQKLQEIAEVEILTSVGYDQTDLNAADKLAWVREFLPQDIKFNYVPKSKHKARYAQYGVLIDDRIKSVAPYREAEGVAIHHVPGDFENSLFQVKQIFNK